MTAGHDHPHGPEAAHGHAHDHGHHHDQPHGHAPGSGHHRHAYGWGILLNTAYLTVEFLVGVMVGSLALVADAAHNLGDVVALVASATGARLAQSPPSQRRTYGRRRWSILIALANGGVLLLGMGALAWEAIHRLAQPGEIPGLTVGSVALIGLVVNLGTALLFRKATELNARAAYLHMAADAGVSAGVAVAGLGIWLTGWAWLDPVVTLVVVLVVVWGSWSLVRAALALALDAVPPGIDPDDVRRWLAGQAGITEVHDLHIWAMSTTDTALTAHLVRDPSATIDDAFHHHLAEGLRTRFGIGHPTIQVETGDPAHPCGLAADGTI